MQIKTVTVTQVERIDLFVNRHLKATYGAVEAVLEANPGLAARGLFTVPGDVITLPAFDATVQQTEETRLWT